MRYKFVQFCVMSCSCNSRNCLIYLSINLSIYLSIDWLLCLESQINDQLAVCRFKKNVGQTITYIFYHLLILNNNAYGRSYIYIYIYIYIRLNVVHLNFLFIKIEKNYIPISIHLKICIIYICIYYSKVKILTKKEQ